MSTELKIGSNNKQDDYETRPNPPISGSTASIQANKLNHNLDDLDEEFVKSPLSVIAQVREPDMTRAFPSLLCRKHPCALARYIFSRSLQR
jgi:hypothetical protein